LASLGLAYTYTKLHGPVDFEQEQEASVLNSVDLQNDLPSVPEDPSSNAEVPVVPQEGGIQSDLPAIPQ
jgi:hypothetical protein